MVAEEHHQRAVREAVLAGFQRFAGPFREPAADPAFQGRRGVGPDRIRRQAGPEMHGPDRPAGRQEQRVLLEDAIDRGAIGHPQWSRGAPSDSVAANAVPGRSALGSIRGADVIEHRRERIPTSDPSAWRDERAVRGLGQQFGLAPRDTIGTPGIENPGVRGILIPLRRLPHAVILPVEIREQYVVYITIGPMDNDLFRLRHPPEPERDCVPKIQHPFRHPWQRLHAAPPGAAEHAHQASDGQKDADERHTNKNNIFPSHLQRWLSNEN